jgi:hypothetical protein
MCLARMPNMENKIVELHILLLVRTVMTDVEILRLEDE